MDDDKKLKLLTSPEPLESPNNFWKVCPRKLDYLPESPCAKGCPVIVGKSRRVQEDPECPWWINSKEHNFCFWRYIHDQSSVDGVMNELVQSELAHLFGWSNTKTHFILKEAVEELTDALETYRAVELLKEIDDDDYREVMANSDFSFEEDDSE